jgi:hypothetical protein
METGLLGLPLNRQRLDELNTKIQARVFLTEHYFIPMLEILNTHRINGNVPGVLWAFKCLCWISANVQSFTAESGESFV